MKSNYKARHNVQLLLTMILAVSSCAVLVAASAFAWFNFNKTISDPIITTSGNIDITSYKATAYKYTYPYFNDDSTGFINYDGAGTIVTTDLTTADLSMNQYDPFYLALHPSESVKNLMTNLCIKLDVTFKATTDVNYSLVFVRDTASPSGGDDKRISNYLDYWVTSTDLSSATSVTYNSTEYTSANDVIFYGMKVYDEANTASKFRSADTGDGITYSSSINLSTTAYSFAGASLNSSGYMEQTVTLYVGMDYNEASLESFSSGLIAGQNIDLSMDYKIHLEVSQA